MKLDSKNLLAERLRQLHCERVPEWVAVKLLPIVDAEAVNVEAKAVKQLRRNIARKITVKVIAGAITTGAPVPTGTGENREGFQGENASSPLEPTVKTANRGGFDVVGHPTTT